MQKLFNGRCLLARAMRAIAFIAMFGVVNVPAIEASQNATVLPNTGTLSGLTMVNTLNGGMDTILSHFSGASAPSSPTQYQFWADTTNNLLKIYVSSSWLTVGSFAGGSWVSYSGSVKETAPTATGSANAYVLTYSPAPTALVTGQTYTFITNFANTGAATLNINSLGAIAITKQGTTALASGDINSGQAVSVVYDGTQFQLTSPTVASAATVTPVPVRQTVLSGPVDSNGLPNFGGSTGSTTVTAAGTLIATAANGFASTGQVDKLCSIVNPSWTGLSTNGTMYLYLDVSAATCTTGSTALAPNYQWGGSFSTTNAQYTFNIQAMQMQVGNGSTASQTYRVFVGEVTVAGGVTTAITWYALQGRYQSALTATLPTTNTTVQFFHNLGVNPRTSWVYAKCTTTDLGYFVGDTLPLATTAGGGYTPITPILGGRNSAYIHTGSSTSWMAVSISSGTTSTMTNANWSYYFIADRGW
jgi:hypothetical protein